MWWLLAGEAILLDSQSWLSIDLLDRLLRQPHTLSVHRVEPDETFPPAALTVRFNQPYLGQPLVDGQPVSQRSTRAVSMLAEAQALLGTYLVEISD